MNNSKGFSLPEVVVSIAIIGVTALGISQLFITGATGTKAMNQTSACVNHLNSVVNRLRSLGTRVVVGDFLPALGGSLVNRWAVDGVGTVAIEQDITAINPADRYPGIATFNITNVPANPADVLLLRSPHLIQGVMGGVLAIYNSNTAAFCTGATGSIYNVPPGPVLSSLFAPSSNAQTLIGLETRIRVQPYNLATGLIDGACPSPLIIAPRGSPAHMPNIMASGRTGGIATGLVAGGPAGTATENQNLVNWGAGVRNDLGLLVTLRANYTDVNAVPMGCTAEMRLQYPEDTGVPGAPNIVINRNSTWDNPATSPATARTGESPVGPLTVTETDVNCQTRTQNDVRFQIGYTVANTNEAGTVLLCRDRSYQLPPPESAAASSYFAACLVGGVPDLSRAQYPPAAYFAPGTDGLPRPQHDNTAWAPGGTVDVPYILGIGAPWGYVPPANFINVGDNIWVPCDQVQVCGENPTGGGVNLGGGVKSYDLIFANLPSGCVMQLDVRSVDSAGNLSPIRSIDNTTVASGANIVEYPRCGVWCGGGAAYGAPQGYFSCGGCP
ncbi:MAG: prepilin-type N-terminal cleavage/methylation domain-containing protein [Bdellovibrionales bacterium]|nr:prepilin-type N-terminal cleavage/methylation domain-containing protein [Bdellovibrionales bacterium]